MSVGNGSNDMIESLGSPWFTNLLLCFILVNVVAFHVPKNAKRYYLNVCSIIICLVWGFALALETYHELLRS